MYFLGNGSNRIITKKAQIDTFQELATGDSVGAKYVVHGSAKAWANLNGTGTIVLRDSLNVSSVVDNGTGDYTLNYTSTYSDANNSPQASSSAPTNTSSVNINGVFAGAVNVTTVNVTGSSIALADVLRLNSATFGNLA